MSSSSSSSWLSKDVVFGIVCPFFGSVLASVMFAAPIRDLRMALLRGSLGDLNPLPWAVMTGNCLGWCAYGYYTQDPFVFCGNLPGLILSLWLNLGAAKIQYKTLTVASAPTSAPTSASAAALNTRAIQQASTRSMSQDEDYYETTTPTTSVELVFTPQEVWFLRIVMAWSLVLVWVGWISTENGHAAETIGILVNINLIFFYGAPLQTIRQVLQKGHSNSIHAPTMIMSITNTTFWLLYGVARWDFIIIVPNGTGLILGIFQAILCAWYPQTKFPLLADNNGNDNEDDNDFADDNMELTSFRDHRPMDDYCTDNNNNEALQPEEYVPSTLID